MTYLIDTAKAIDQIESAGLSREQASAIVNTFADVGDQIATRADVERLQADIDSLRIETKAGIESLKNYLLFRMALMQIAGIGVLFALLKLFLN